MIENLSETEFALSIKKDSFVSNEIVNISKYMIKKIQIVKVYNSEIQNPPFPRGEIIIKALASLRGSASGCDFAESLKEVI
jgi:hypothetical protein